MESSVCSPIDFINRVSLVDCLDLSLMVFLDLHPRTRICSLTDRIVLGALHMVYCLGLSLTVSLALISHGSCWCCLNLALMVSFTRSPGCPQVFCTKHMRASRASCALYGL